MVFFFHLRRGEGGKDASKKDVVLDMLKRAPVFARDIARMGISGFRWIIWRLRNEGYRVETLRAGKQKAYYLGDKAKGAPSLGKRKPPPSE